MKELNTELSRGIDDETTVKQQKLIDNPDMSIPIDN